MIRGSQVASFVALVLAGGCIKSDSLTCGDGRLCPVGSVCDDTHALCVSPDQITQCQGQADQTACATGNCQGGVCLPIACGNGRVDMGEACDDGNTIGGDGCAADCHSTEACGNSIVDTLAGEQCDDGNHLDHDGCSSACQLETLDWQQVTNPGPLVGAHAAYDAATGQVVVFGGTRYAGTGYADLGAGQTTAVWNGRWRQIDAAIGPAARTGFMMAYDHSRGRVVVFGGAIDTNHPYADTWEWDGGRWQRGPDGPARSYATMAYDARLKRIVLFGGLVDNNTYADTMTWLYDGTTWTPQTTATAPPTTIFADMTYDPDRDVVVMFGGREDGSPSETNTVWEFNGTTWRNATPSSGGPAGTVEAPGLAYSAGLHTVVLYGGMSSPGVPQTSTSAMWTWNGTAWTAFAGATPTQRGHHVLVDDGRGGLLVYGGTFQGSQACTGCTPTTGDVDTWVLDPVANAWHAADPPGMREATATATSLDHAQSVIFGGGRIIPSPGTIAYYTDTWRFDGLGWTLGPTGPANYDNASLAYDEAHARYVLFGGQTAQDTTIDNETWLLDTNGAWTQQHPTLAPPPRISAAMAYDAAHAQVVLFGGTDSDTIRGDTWTWDGSAWTQQNPAHSPPAQGDGVLAYDRARQNVVFVGNGDTWIWDGSDWHQVTPAVSPLARIDATLMWNPAHATLVLIGGQIGSGGLFDAWEWNGTTWTQIGTMTRPVARSFEAVFGTADGAGIEMFGGAQQPLSARFTSLGDQWELRSDRPRGSDACVLPIDVDGDGLIGCADPDCWRVCAPLCPPDTSCPASAPQCGNGVCDPLETCHTCPQDCTTCTPVCGDFVCDPGETCPGDCS